MKTKKLLASLLVLLALSFAIPMDTIAQKHSKNKKGNGPPAWAPAHGYRNTTRHVYFPDYNVYYDVQNNKYLYRNAGFWTSGYRLPTRYAQYNLQSAKMVELELNTNKPYKYNASHVAQYKSNLHKPNHQDKHIKVKSAKQKKSKNKKR